MQRIYLHINILSYGCLVRRVIRKLRCWLLKSLGFNKIDIFGAKLGAFSRGDVLNTEDFEMLVIAER